MVGIAANLHMTADALGHLWWLSATAKTKRHKVMRRVFLFLLLN